MPNIRNRSAELIAIIALLSAISIPIMVSQYTLTLPLYWNKPLLIDAVRWATGVLALSIPLQLLKFKIRYTHQILIATLLGYLTIGVGTLNSLATVYFLASSYLLGRIALRQIINEDVASTLFDRALLIGLALNTCIFTILTHYPVNNQFTYISILGLPLIALLHRNFRINVLTSFTAESKFSLSRLQQIPFWLLTFMVMVAGYVFRFAFFPTIGFDDNVLHLRLWAELSNTQQYSFNIENQIWSLAPFAVDLLHSIISIVSNSDARGAMNLAIAGLILRAVWALSSHLLTQHIDKALLLLLFCSTPILATLLTSLQTELVLAFLITSGIKILLEDGTVDPNSKSLALLAVAALCAAVKLPGMVLGVMLLVAYIPTLLSERPNLRTQQRKSSLAIYILLIIVLTFTALQPYIYSWYVSGNPLFPLYNEIFKSPFYAIRNFADPLYQKGFTFHSYWSTFYQTGSYYESENFVAGFQYLYFLPIALIALLVGATTKKIKIAIIVPTLGFGVIMFYASQYWRYLFPVVPLASVVIGYLLSKSSDLLTNNKIATWTTRAMFLVFIGINGYFLPGVTWYLTTPTQVSFTEKGKSKVTELVAPSKSVSNYLNTHSENPTVLFDPSATYGATLFGNPFYVTWYAPKQVRAFGNITSKADVAALIDNGKIDYVVWNSSISAEKRNRIAMQEFLTAYGQPVYQAGLIILYKLSKHELSYKPLFKLHSESATDQPENQAVSATTTPTVISTIKVTDSKSVKYDVTFECSNEVGSFIAQINWNISPPYYKLVPCSRNRTNFTETLPIPEGATSGDIYITARDRERVEIIDLNIGVN